MHKSKDKDKGKTPKERGLSQAQLDHLYNNNGPSGSKQGSTKQTIIGNNLSLLSDPETPTSLQKTFRYFKLRETRNHVYYLLNVIT